MVLPDFLFMVYKVLIDFSVELCYVWVVGVGFSEIVSIVNFGEDVGWYGFCSFANVASGYVHFVGL